LQIALLGAGLGALVGLALGALMVGYFRTLMPLPVWRHAFQLGIFLRAAALGLVLPFVATLYPVWRAVRVAPVDAISTGVRRSRSPMIRFARGGRSGRGHSIGVLPLRNVRRSPRRTVLTALGISAAIAVLLGVIGMIDSFRATADRAHAELVSSSPRRLTISLTAFVPTTAPPVVAVQSSPLVARSATEVDIPATVRQGSTSIDLLVIVGDLDGPIWRPHVADRRHRPGIVLTHKAIQDLGTAVGERVLVRYPRRVGLGYEFVTERLPIVGATSFPLRSLAWMDDGDGLARTNLEGIANVVIVEPRPHVSAGRVERAFFGIEGVASVQPVTSFTDSIKKELDRALGILLIVEGVVLLLALLIAFNTASINADDRAREHATMFAFGLPVRSVVGVEIVESLIVGLIGTATGLAGGYVLLHWLNTSLLPTTVPDIGIVTAVATTTLVLALLMGVVAVAFAPVLTLRKLLRMDIPSTLRVVE
jgi:putative ABC transport system permease protein